MKDRSIIVCFIIFLINFIMISCQSLSYDQKTIDVNGMVYDFSNRPVFNCEIIIGDNYRTSTDINGRFTLSRIPIGDYTISGHKKGFESYFDLISVKERGQIVYLRIPSQNQLLIILDESLSLNELSIAAEIAERAYKIDSNNLEMLFYYAILKFKQKEYEEAIDYLEKAITLGFKDYYVYKFLTILKEIQYEN